VLFSQLVDDDLGCASYLVGCEVSREVVAVDPPFATEQLLAEASHHGARIVRVVETHTHADHVSGHGRLALEHGVPVSIHPDADVDYPHDALSDGGEITVGNVTLRCIHTPGHRPEHCCLTVTDRTRAEEPWLLLTGDSLFVGDAARPDLAVEAREGAEGLFHSLQRLLELPDGVEVYPGHVAGSLCGRSMSSKASTTIGFERRFNPMLRLNLVDDFVAESGSVAAPKPPNAARIVELNRGPWVGPPDDAQELDAPPAETQLLDARPIGDFLAGHRRGSFSVPVSGKSFATRAAFVLDPEEQVTVVARDAGEAERAIRGLRSVAVLGISGYLLGEGRERMDPVSLEELEQLIASDAADVIDVREKDERDAGYIPGSRNIPYRLMRLCCPDLPADRSLVTICESGARATIAASILRTRGYHARPVAHAGMEEWLARGGDSVSFRRCGSG
jgi:glyoxylase-like metal-dependent hydrolase (beta-lactamase superfamily II)/rhodanese-related sulfurtransferase